MTNLSVKLVPFASQFLKQSRCQTDKTIFHCQKHVSIPIASWALHDPPVAVLRPCRRAYRGGALQAGDGAGWLAQGEAEGTHPRRDRGLYSQVGLVREADVLSWTEVKYDEYHEDYLVFLRLLLQAEGRRRRSHAVSEVLGVVTANSCWLDVDSYCEAAQCSCGIYSKCCCCGFYS